jgi:predicted amidohydrolase YtcJ
LTGHVGDRATAVFEKLIAYKPTRDDYRAGAKLISQMMASKGVTSACDADATPEDLQGYQDARDAGELRLRIYSHITVRALDRMIAAGLHTGFGDEWVRLGAIKQYADGSISERTAWLSQPYIGMGDYRGLQVSTREDLYDNSRKAHAAGWQLGTHANGDVAIEEIIGVYEQIQRELPRRDPRYRIEHCTLLNPSLIQRMKALNVIPAPFSCYVYFHGDVMHFYGEERLKRMFPMPGRRPAPHRLLRLHRQPVRSHDVAAVPGHAHRYEGKGVGRQPAHHCGRSDSLRHHQRGVRFV